jgi:hypothetical protein
MYEDSEFENTLSEFSKKLQENEDRGHHKLKPNLSHDWLLSLKEKNKESYTVKHLIPNVCGLSC